MYLKTLLTGQSGTILSKLLVEQLASKFPKMSDTDISCPSSKQTIVDCSLKGLSFLKVYAHVQCMLLFFTTVKCLMYTLM